MEPFAVANDGRVFTPNSLEVMKFVEQGLTVEAALGTVVMEYNKTLKQ